MLQKSICRYKFVSCVLFHCQSNCFLWSSIESTAEDGYSYIFYRLFIVCISRLRLCAIRKDLSRNEGNFLVYKTLYNPDDTDNAHYMRNCLVTLQRVLFYCIVFMYVFSILVPASFQKVTHFSTPSNYNLRNYLVNDCFENEEM